ncbi:MAG: DUF3137 domain-containing protein [bacterium]|nr:DUF3137 domain-containing protein [bacterium]
MKTINDLWAYYNTTLLPDLRVMENERKNIANKVLILNIVGGIVMFFCLILFFVIYFFVLILVIPAIIGWIVLYQKFTKSYVSQFKTKVIFRVIKFIDENLEYNPASCIGSDTYYASKLFQHGVDRYNGDDLVYGFIEKTRIMFSELHTEYKTQHTDSKGHTHTQYHTIFRGIFFVADFNKNFSGQTIVLPDTAQKMFGGWLGNILQSWNFTRDQLIKLEDPEFERLFVVYGTDQIEARYILSTSLMRRIVEFKKKTRKDIRLSFISNHVFVAISNNKNMFEPRLFKTLLDFNVIREYYEDLIEAVSVVEELNLNTRIWSKQ